MAAPKPNIGSAGDIPLYRTIKAATCELENDSIDVIWRLWCFSAPTKVGKEAEDRKTLASAKDCAYATRPAWTVLQTRLTLAFAARIAAARRAWR